MVYFAIRSSTSGETRTELFCALRDAGASWQEFDVLDSANGDVLKCMLAHHTHFDINKIRGPNDDTILFKANLGERDTQLLIEAKADVNALNKRCQTALFSILGYPYSCYPSRVPAIKCLLNAGLNLFVKDRDGKLAIDYMPSDKADNDEAKECKQFIQRHASFLLICPKLISLVGCSTMAKLVDGYDR